MTLLVGFRRLPTIGPCRVPLTEHGSRGIMLKATSQQNPSSTDAVRDDYFQGYSGLAIHETMLRDKARTHAYRRAIRRLGPLLEDKVVLDVGCGTGILSLFAASAGAAHVYAVDASAMAGMATRIVRDNDMHKQITVIQGRIEDVQLPVDKVDVIISEWMGYFLLYESMLDSVLVARDRWLAPGGVMMPDSATLVLVGLEREEVRQAKLGFWQDVYGYSMRAMREPVLEQVYVETVAESSVCTSAAVLQELDLMEASVADTEFAVDFEVTAVRDCTLHALAGYFDVGFTQGSKPVVLSTAPSESPTHWRQSVLYLEGDVEMRKGEKLRGRVGCKKNADRPRTLDIQLDYAFKNAVSKRSGSKMYRLH